MLIYLIPLIIILGVIFVVMKKRQAEADSNKATQAKAKKANSSARTTPQRNSAIEDSVSAKKATTALGAETRKKIEALIEERNFFSAEAQINQALKRDNTQHELYLYLLDIHILQKDEFAISQLFSHVRSLQLDEILAQAEERKAAFDQTQNAKQDTIDYPHPTQNSAATAANNANNADFDALMDAPAKPKAEFNFDNSELKSRGTSNVEEIKPLEFNMSFDNLPKAASVETIKEETKALDFGNLNLEPAPSIQLEKATDVAAVEHVIEVAPVVNEEAPTLNFSLDSETPTAVIEEPAPSLNVTPTLDFSLASEEKVEDAAPIIDLSAETKTEEQIQPLDFSFSLDKPVTETVPQTLTDAPTLDFKLDHFSTDSNTTAEPSALDFNLTAATAVVEKPTMIEDAAPVVAATTSIDENDPLVKSFPELLQTNEISLNLDLAQQYIQLGAYDAARELLAEKDAEYSAQQRQQADQLLNQIAS